MEDDSKRDRRLPEDGDWLDTLSLTENLRLRPSDGGVSVEARAPGSDVWTRLHDAPTPAERPSLCNKVLRWRTTDGGQIVFRLPAALGSVG